MKRNNHYINSICINLCSACNLRCNWCYKQFDAKSFLSYSDLLDFFNKIIKQNINNIVLIGGEPTIHPEFFSILNVLSYKKVYLSTNGLMFSQQKFLKDCVKTRKSINGYITGLQAISVSLKGYDKHSFVSTTKVDEFERLCHAINNLRDCEIPVTYNYTFSNDIMLDEISKILKFLIEYGIRSIIINDTRPYLAKSTIIQPNMVKNLDKLVYLLESKGIATYFRPNHPLCKYDPRLINFTLDNKRLISSCTIKKNSGFFFTDSLELIPCNELYSIILGKYKTDFDNFNELKCLWNSQFIQNFYQRLSGCPKSKCIECNLWNICGGSCILHWIKEETK